MLETQYSLMMSLIVLGVLGALGALVIGSGLRPRLQPATARHRLPRNRRGR